MWPEPRELDREFEFRLGLECLSSLYVVLPSAGRGLAASGPLVQGILPYVVKLIRDPKRVGGVKIMRDQVRKWTAGLYEKQKKQISCVL
jgi:hypothetical protein